MTHWKRIAVILLLLVLGVGGRVIAQDFGEGDNPPTQASDPTPVNPAQAAYENGKLLVTVSSPRQYAYRIGDNIPVTIVIEAQPGIDVNTDAIVHQSFSPDGSDFECSLPPVITHTIGLDGKNVTTITLVLRSWVTKTSLPFDAGFLYATAKLPDGKPDWIAASIPQFIVTTSNTATDASKYLQDGDLDAKSSDSPVLVMPLTITGGLLLLFPLSLLGYGLYRRFNPPTELTPSQTAWKNIEAVLASTDETGATYEQTQRLAYALRGYLQLELVPPTEVKEKLEAFFSAEQDRFELARLAQESLSILDRVLYEKPEENQEKNVRLSRRELIELMARVQRYIPQADRAQY